MSELKPLICTGCGGHIDRQTLTCKSCGTAYRLDDNFMPVRIELKRGDVVTLCNEVHIPREYVIGNKDVAMEMTLKEMAKNMAEKILPLIEYETEYDMRRNMYVTHGRLRVVDPHWH